MVSSAQSPWPLPVTAVGRCQAGTILFRWGGTLYLTAVAKVACSLVPGAVMRRTDAPELLSAEAHHRENPVRTIRATTDLVPYLPRVDVLFTGHAYPPPGRPVPMMPVRLAVQSDQRTYLDKTLHVHGARTGPVPAPLQAVPIVYERAYGGIGFADNPHGTGFTEGSPPPEIEAPGAPGVVAGFGPISRTLRSRRNRLEGLSRKDLDRPLPDLPGGFDWAYFQAAPEDQQVDDLRGDEWIVLQGLHPAHSTLSSRLPGLRGAARIHGMTPDDPDAWSTVDLRLDILHIDGDAEAVSLVLRAIVPIEDDNAVERIRVVIGVATDGEPIHWPPPPPVVSRAAQRSPPRAPPPPARAPDRTIALEDAGPRAPLLTIPFDDGAPAGPPPARSLGQTHALDPEESARAARGAHLPFAGDGQSHARADRRGPAATPIPGAPWSSVPVAPLADPDPLEITNPLTDDDEPTRKYEDAPPRKPPLAATPAPPPEEPAPPSTPEPAPDSDTPTPRPSQLAAPPEGSPPAPSWSWAPSPAPDPVASPAPRPSAPRIPQKKDVNDTLYGGFGGRKK